MWENDGKAEEKCPYFDEFFEKKFLQPQKLKKPVFSFIFLTWKPIVELSLYYIL